MSLAEARERLLLSFRFSPQTERVPVPQARGRVTAEPVYARLSMPPFPAAAMDGIAVRADRTRDASPRSEEHTSELQSRENLVCLLLLEKKQIAHLSRCS